MKLSLMVMSEGKAKGQMIPITLSQFVIGRDPQCNLRPASALISKRHCALLVKNSQVFIRDFNSTNGTFVNEEPVKAERPLKNQDLLRIGPLVFQVVLETPTPLPAKLPQAATPTKTEEGTDEDVAAMLLALGDDTSSGTISDSQEEVPGGSTIMDLVPPALSGQPSKPEEAAKGTEKKPDPAKPATGTSSSAAEAILKKYQRRTRG